MTAREIKVRCYLCKVPVKKSGIIYRDGFRSSCKDPEKCKERKAQKKLRDAKEMEREEYLKQWKN